MWPFKNPLKKNEQFVQVDVSPSETRKLMTEQAVYQFWDTLGHETDSVLKNLGKTREDLKKLLDEDDEVYAAVETRRDALIATPWRLEGNQHIVDFVYEQINPFMPDLLEDLFAARLYGYSVVETVYKKENGKKLLILAKQKPFQWFQPRRSGELFYYGENNLGMGIPVDQNKFILTTCGASYERPMGVPLLSKVYWPAFYRKNGWQFWLKWMERCGFPSRVGKTPPGILPDGSTRADDLADALQEMAQNSTIVVADDQEVNLLEPGRNGEYFPKFDSVVSKRIQKTILGQTLTTDVGDKGSFAAAKVHNEVRDDKRLSDVRMITRSMQHLVDVIVGLNFSGSQVDFIMEDARGLEKERAERDKILIDAGAIELSEDYLLDRYDFNQGDFVIPEKKPEKTPQQFKFAAAKKKFTKDQQAIEDLADDMLKNLASPVPNELIYSAIRSATSPEDLQDRLAVIMQDFDAEEFERVLSYALFSADIMGFVNA
jgi:phage gp29-like protein